MIDLLYDIDWPKTCSCCRRTISEDLWRSLRLDGTMEGTVNGRRFARDLELRTCSCGSTLAVPLK